MGFHNIMMAVASTQAFVLTISVNTSQYNILTQAQSIGYDNSTGSEIIVNVGAGVTVSATSTHAMQTGALHADTTLTINITGSVDGYTGTNGTKDQNGSVGGDAIYWDTATGGIGVYTINLTGNLRGGGGGGGGGGHAGVLATQVPSGEGGYSCLHPLYTGSDGAQASPGGFGEVGGHGDPGTYDSSTGSLNCINTTIGPGGSGGAAGYALRELGRTVTLNNNGGTVAGTVG